MKQLIKKLNEASEAYYNTGKPIMSDAEYDALLDTLQRFEKETGTIMANSPTLKVGAVVLNELPKTKINPPMLSLAKCHSAQEIKDFNAIGKDLIAMLKCDGLSVRLVYEDGELVSANTRGDGETGAVITEHIKQFINVPIKISKSGKYVIDGEAIIKESDFDSNEFANPRNAAAGALNLLDTKEVKRRKLSFIAWDVIYGTTQNLLTDKLTEADTLGFETVNYASGVEDIDEANALLTASAKQGGIPIDGIVWKFNDTNYGATLGRTSHHYRCGIAWKPEQVIKETILRNIEWSGGRTGYLTPVAIFDEVEILGAKITRASLSNITVMTDILGEKPYKGQKIWVTRSNMIIPQVIKSEKEE